MRRATTTDYRGQRVLLVGLGLHGGGVATVRWLVRQGAIIRVTDLKTARELAPSLKQLAGLKVVFHLGGHRIEDWRWAERIVVNPGLYPAAHPQLAAAAKRGVPIDNEASIFVGRFRGRMIGVTGTRGKTTTTLLLGAMVQQTHPQTIISGNVRQIPMLAYLPTTRSSTWAVVELSSYQLERLPVARHPFDVAIMTNLKIDHINRHGSLAAYTQTKYNIFRGQTSTDLKVLNWNDPAGRKAQPIGHGQTLWFGLHLPHRLNGITIRTGYVIEQLQGQHRRLFPLSAWRLPGEHNTENLLAAVAGARGLHLPAAAMARAARHFRGVPYRQELVRTYAGHRMINDTSATSPDATLAALAIYPRGVYIIGGTDKQLNFTPLLTAIVRRNVPTVFLPGTATEHMQAQLRKLRYRRPLVSVRSMSAAVDTALAMAKPKQDIVLSPGAASFGLFVHEFDRGDQFTAAVKTLS